MQRSVFIASTVSREWVAHSHDVPEGRFQPATLLDTVLLLSGVHHFCHVRHFLWNIQVILHVPRKIFNCHIIHKGPGLLRARAWRAWGSSWWQRLGVILTNRSIRCHREGVLQAREFVHFHILPQFALTGFICTCTRLTRVQLGHRLEVRKLCSL